MKLMKIYLTLNERSVDSVGGNSSFVVDKLNGVKPSLIDKDLGNLEIQKILNKAFAGSGIYFDYHPTFDYVRDDFAEVGIEMGYIDEAGRITIAYGSDFYKTFEDDFLWNNFIHVCRIIVSHEMTHKNQILKMRRQLSHIPGVNMTSNSSYLSDKREIMAFAREAVEDYTSKGYSKQQIIQLLKTPKGSESSQAMPQESYAFWYYYDYFYGYNDKVWNRFIKSIVQIINTLHGDK